MTKRLLAFGLAVGALFGVLLAVAAPASAHASVVSSDPVDGSRLQSAPSVVTITFDEAVSLGNIGYLHVTDQAGRRVDAGAAYHPGNDGAKIADRLQSGLGDATFTASFRVISADSHPVAGTVRFVVGNGALGASQLGASIVNRATSVVFEITRWACFAGLALLVGSWLLWTVWPQGRDDRRARAIVWLGFGLSALGAMAELLVQGPYTAGTGLSDVANLSLLDGTLHTSYGQYHCARLVLLGASAVFLGWAMQGDQRRSRAEGVAVLLGGGLALTFSALGHAATTAPAWLSITADLVHISAMAVWLGGLVLILGAVLPRHEPEELRAALAVFSPVAFWAIVALAVTGSYAAWRGVGTVHAVFMTTYGWLVVLKIVLFLAIVTVGNYARRSVQRRSLEFGTERVRRSVIVELALAAGVLALTAVLVAQPRGKQALAIAEARPVSASATLGGGRTLTVTVVPGRHGNVSTTVEVRAPSPLLGVSATATLGAKQIGPIPLELNVAGPNLYASSGVNLPAAGNWVITVIVTTSEFDATTTAVTIHLY